jgi:hypothetical protein
MDRHRKGGQDEAEEGNQESMHGGSRAGLRAGKSGLSDED